MNRTQRNIVKLLVLVAAGIAVIIGAAISQGATVTGNVQNAFGVPAATLVRFIPKSQFVNTNNGGTVTVERIVSVPVDTNGNFTATNVYGGWYDTDAGFNTKYLRILVPFNDTNTYTMFQVAQLAINAGMYPTPLGLSSTSGPGLLTTLPGNAALFLDGAGAWIPAAGGGTVTSVGASVPGGFAAGSPVTTAGNIPITAQHALGVLTNDGTGNTGWSVISSNQIASASLDIANFSQGAIQYITNLMWVLSNNTSNFVKLATNTISANQLTNTLNIQADTNIFSALGIAHIQSLAGSGGGSVTSVGFTPPGGFTAPGSPVTTTGTIVMTPANSLGAYTNDGSGHAGWSVLSSNQIALASLDISDFSAGSIQYLTNLMWVLSNNTSNFVKLATNTISANQLTNTLSIQADTNIFSAAGIAHIQSLLSGSAPTGPAGGALSGTYPNPGLAALQSNYPQAITNNDNRAGGIVVNEPVTVTNAMCGWQVLPTGTNITLIAWGTNSLGVIQTNKWILNPGSIGGSFNLEVSNTNGVDTFSITQDGWIVFGTNKLALISTNGIGSFAGITNNSLTALSVTASGAGKQGVSIFSVAAGDILSDQGSNLPAYTNTVPYSVVSSNDANGVSLTERQLLFYAATNGLISNTGLSPYSPWPLLYAITNAAHGTVILLPGVYSNTITLGTTNTGITIRSQVKWGAQLTGAAGLQTVIGPLTVSNVTLDGLNIGPSYIDCVKFYGGINETIRNCWIHDAAHGDPAWVTNNSGSYQGNGILAEQSVNLLVENCLIENNGAYRTHDQGVYTSGTNGVIRNNVIRYNCATGVQITDSTSGAVSTNFCVYNNLIVNNFTFVDNGSIQVLFYGSDPATTGIHPTNFLYGNTIISTNQAYAVMAQYGCQLMMTNNIIVSPYSSGACLGQSGTPIGQIYADYNVITNTLGSSGVTAGSHGVTTTYAALAFDVPVNGLYWIGSGSSAKGVAVSTSLAFGPVDFWGRAQSSISDAGAFQYSSLLAGDYRVLDPSPAVGADYWSTIPGITQSNYYGANFVGGAFSGLQTGLTNSSGRTITQQINDATNSPAVSARASGDAAGTPFINGYIPTTGGSGTNETFSGTTAVASLSITNPGTTAITVPTGLASDGKTFVSNATFPTSLLSGALNSQSLTGRVEFIQWDDGAFMTNGNYNSNAITYVTPSAGSGGLQGSAPFYLLYPLTPNVGGTAVACTNQFFTQTYMPPSWNSNAVNYSVDVMLATNGPLTATTMVFSVSASWNGSALTTPVTVTNNVPLGTGLLTTNFVVGPIPTSGTILPNESVVFQVQYWSVGNGKITNNAWVLGTRCTYTNSVVQNGAVTGW